MPAGKSWVGLPPGSSDTSASPAHVSLNKRLVNARSAKDVVDLVETHHRDCNSVNLATALMQFARFQHSQRSARLPGLPK